MKFYISDVHPGGNSYYKERNDIIFPKDSYKIMKTNKLDTVVINRKFPLPDFIKIDV